MEKESTKPERLVKHPKNPGKKRQKLSKDGDVSSRKRQKLEEERTSLSFSSDDEGEKIEFPPSASDSGSGIDAEGETGSDSDTDDRSLRESLTRLISEYKKEKGKEIIPEEDLKTSSSDESDDEGSLVGEKDSNLEEEPVHSKVETVLTEPKKQRRWTLFVGNLPFVADKKGVEAFFDSCSPCSVRILTKKGTSESKGVAFVDFSAEKDAWKALKLHHSVFPGSTRKVNVELTSGGGGRNPQRVKAIKKKNERVRVQRKKHFEKIIVKKKEKKESE